MKVMRKSLSLLLAVLMLLSAVAVSAAALDEIGEVTVSGITPPVAGETPDFIKANSGDRMLYNVSNYGLYLCGYYWYHNDDSPVEEDEQFVEGEIYYVEIKLDAAEEHSFTSPLSATVNDEPANSSVVVANKGKNAYIYHSFTCSAAETKVISNVEIKGVVEPAAGDYPKSDFATDEHVEIDEVKWYEDGEEISAQYAFENGVEYELVVILSLEPGYTFATDDAMGSAVKVEIPGYGQSVNGYEGDPENRIVVHTFFTAEAADPVDSSEEPSSLTEPETTEPETTEPETTEPVTDEPETTAPVTTEPETTEPTTNEPETTEPVTDEPETTEPITTEPETTVPVTTEPETTAPATTEPATTEPVTTEPVTTEPATTAPKPTEAPTTAPTEPASSKPETPVSPGSSLKDAEKAIKESKTDEPKGTTFGLLCARAVNIGKNSITIGWNKLSGAKKYIIYANACGTTNKFKKLKTLSKSKNKLKVTKMFGKKLKKGTYYKFLVVAIDKKNKVLSTAKTLHIVTKGGKRGNFKSVTTAAKKNKVTLKKKGSKFKLNAKAVLADKKSPVSVHRKIKYETDNKKLVTVSKNGVIKAKKKGTCCVYVYAQSGTYKKIKVKVG